MCFPHSFEHLRDRRIGRTYLCKPPQPTEHTTPLRLSSPSKSHISSTYPISYPHTTSQTTSHPPKLLTSTSARLNSTPLSNPLKPPHTAPLYQTPHHAHNAPLTSAHHTHSIPPTPHSAANRLTPPRSMTTWPAWHYGLLLPFPPSWHHTISPPSSSIYYPPSYTTALKVSVRTSFCMGKAWTPYGNLWRCTHHRIVTWHT